LQSFGSDAFQKHEKRSSVEGGFNAPFSWEGAFFQPFVPDDEAILVPEEDFDVVPSRFRKMNKAPERSSPGNSFSISAPKPSKFLRMLIGS